MCFLVKPTDSYGKYVNLRVYLGGIQRDATGRVIGANAFSVYYSLETNIDQKQRELFNQWKEQMIAQGKNSSSLVGEIVLQFDKLAITFCLCYGGVPCIVA